MDFIHEQEYNGGSLETSSSMLSGGKMDHSKTVESETDSGFFGSGSLSSGSIGDNVSDQSLTSGSMKNFNGRSVDEISAAFSIMLLGEKQDKSEHGNSGIDYDREEEVFLSINRQLFTQDPISKDSQLMLMIVKAKSQKDTETIKTALEYVLHPHELDVQNDHMQTALMLSVLCRLSQVTSDLVLHGSNVKLLDIYGNSAFHYACTLGDTACLHALTSSRQSPEQQQETLQVLAWRNKEGYNCVDLAIKNRRFDIFDYLINKFQVDINYQDKTDGNTALHKAVIARDLEMVALFLQYTNINVNAKNYCCSTPLRLLYTTDGNTMMDQTIEKLLLSSGALP